MLTTLLTVSLALSQTSPLAEESRDPVEVRVQTEVARAAREFRRTVYDQFHTDRAAFDDRWVTGDELWRQWIAAGSPVSHGPEVIGWFHEATARSRYGAASMLPELPVLPERTLPATMSKNAVPSGANTAAQSPSVELLPPAEITTPDVASPPLSEAPSLEAPALPENADAPFLPAPQERPGDASTGSLPGKIHSFLDFTESLISRTPRK